MAAGSHCIALARTAQNPLLLIIVVQLLTLEHVKLFLSNGCCIFAYLAVIAQQQIHMPQY
jgi:hypothetical protein